MLRYRKFHRFQRKFNVHENCYYFFSSCGLWNFIWLWTYFRGYGLLSLYYVITYYYLSIWKIAHDNLVKVLIFCFKIKTCIIRGDIHLKYFFFVKLGLVFFLDLWRGLYTKQFWHLVATSDSDHLHNAGVLSQNLTVYTGSVHIKHSRNFYNPLFNQNLFFAQNINLTYNCSNFSFRIDRFYPSNLFTIVILDWDPNLGCLGWKVFLTHQIYAPS